MAQAWQGPTLTDEPLSFCPLALIPPRERLDLAGIIPRLRATIRRQLEWHGQSRQPLLVHPERQGLEAGLGVLPQGLGGSEWQGSEGFPSTRGKGGAGGVSRVIEPAFPVPAT